MTGLIKKAKLSQMSGFRHFLNIKLFAVISIGLFGLSSFCAATDAAEATPFVQTEEISPDLPLKDEPGQQSLSNDTNELEDTAEAEEEYMEAKFFVQYLDVLKELKGAISIRDFSKDPASFYKTQTGIYLKTFYDSENPEKALEQFANDMLGTILKKIENLKKNDPTYNEADGIYEELKHHYDRVYLELLALLRRCISKEMENQKNYYVFYHAHMPELRLYYDMLRAFSSYLAISNVSNNPFRASSALLKYKNIPEFLKLYEAELKAYAKTQHLEFVSKDTQNSTFGFGFGPDHITWAKIHLLSANLTLGGNRLKLGENTLYYFLNAFSHMSLDKIDFLLKTLLESFVEPQEVEKKLKRYKDLFQKYLSESQGNLVQIFIKKDKVERLAFPSWPFGIPIYIERKSKRVAVNSLNAGWPAPYIASHPRSLRLVSSSDYMKEFTIAPEKFIENYAFRALKGRKNVIDFAQVRLIMDPASFVDSSTVKTVCYTRNRISPAMLDKYYKGLDEFVREDMSSFVKKTNLGDDNILSRLLKYLQKKFSGGETTTK